MLNMNEPKLMTMEQVREGLSDRKLKQVSRESGVKYHTVLEVANGKRPNPTYDTYIALVNYLAK